MSENKKKTTSEKTKILYTVLTIYTILAVLILIIGIYGTMVSYANSLFDKIERDEPEETILIQSEDVFDTEGFHTDLETIQETDIVFREHEIDSGIRGRTEEGIYNILLIGEDHAEVGDYRGNTDVLMVATVNTNDSSVKLTSFMRDMYVEIPEYMDNKLNSVYAKGGVPLLYDTFSANFDLELDGYFLVNFESFAKVIDLLGGVEVTLNYEEAEYLNMTNYIGNAEERAVIEGTQQMTGAQALGYARIRYVGNSDYERTERQRKLLTAIFEEFKNKNLLEMISIMEEVFPLLKTDLSNKDIFTIATKALSANLKELETYRVPVDGTFYAGTIMSMSVLVVDFEENARLVHEFIFGEDYSMDSETEEAKGTEEDIW